MKKHNKPLKYLIIGWFIFAVFGFVAFRGASAVELVITNQSGEAHIFYVELAENKAKLRRGLMFQKHLSADAGMLFVVNPPRITSMWMQNTYIPLDMVFIDENNVITQITEAKPHDLTPVHSNKISKYVLEINAGTAAKLNIKIGDAISLKQ
jgi:uncharacterized protein